MNKQRYAKFIAEQRKQYEDKPCENCGKEHDHSYGSGRFCSKKCKDTFVGKRNKEKPRKSVKSVKVKKHLDDLREAGIISKLAPYGTWKCKQCNLIFRTKAELNQHLVDCHGKLVYNSTKCDDGYKCPYCDKCFKTSKQLGGHLAHCPNHPNKKLHDKAHKQKGQTYSKNLKTGKFKHKPHKHSIKTKERLSIVRAKQVQNEYQNNFHAKVKWYKVKNLNDVEFSVRGMWELNVAKRLNELGYIWIKANSISYMTDYTHHYTPDFYIPELDLYIEVKGRYPNTDRIKMKAVHEQHPELKIYFIHEEYEDFISGKIGLSDNMLLNDSDFILAE